MANIGQLSLVVSANAGRFVAGMAQAKTAATSFAAVANPNRLLSGFNSGLARAGSAVDGVFGPLKRTLSMIPLVGASLAAFPTSVGGFIAWYKEGADQILNLRKTSLKLGIDVQALSGILLMAGGDADSLTRGLFKLAQQLGAVSAGGRDAKEWMKSFNASVAAAPASPYRNASNAFLKEVTDRAAGGLDNTGIAAEMAARGIEHAAFQARNFGIELRLADMRSTSADAHTAADGFDTLAKSIRGAGSAIEGIKNAQKAAANAGGRFGGATPGLELLNMSEAAGKAVKSFGLFGQTAGEVLKQIDSLTTGGRDASATFAQLGLNGQQLAAMPLDKALGVIADRVRVLPSAGERAFAAFKLFGKGGAELLPILAKGSEGIERYAKKAEMFGLAVTAAQVEQVYQAKKAIQEMTYVWEGSKRQLAVAFAPVVTGLVEELGRLKISATDVADYVLTGVEKIATGVAYLVDSFHLLGAIWPTIKLGFAVIGAAGIEAAAQIAEAMDRAIDSATRLGRTLVEAGKLALKQSLGGRVTEEDLAEAAKRVNNFEASNGSRGLREMADAAKETLRKMKADIIAGLGDTSAVDKVGAFFAKVRAKIEAARKGKAGAKDEQSTLEWFQKLQDLYAKGETVTKAAESPLDTFFNKVRELNQLVNVGAISWDIYARSIGKAYGDLEKLDKMETPKAPQGLIEGSKEVISAIAAFRRQGEGDQGGNAQQRMEQLFKDMREAERQQVEQGKQVVDSLKGIFARGI